MSWNKVTLTKSGEELLSSMMNGSKLIFTRVVIGDKTVADEKLSVQTAVFSPISAPALISGSREVPSKNGTEILIQIRNDGISETTRMKQIGLFAKTEHMDEVMLGILQDETGEEIPAYSDFPQFLIELSVTVGISRTNNINVQVNPSVYVSRTELDALMADYSPMSIYVISTEERDPNKPDYSGGGGGGGSINSVTLTAKKYTGTAEITLCLDDGEYDGTNIHTESNANDGDLIIS